MSADTCAFVSTSTTSSPEATSTSTSTSTSASTSSTLSSSSTPSSSSCSHFPRIDLHTHILPEHIPDFAARYGYGEFIKLQHHHECKARMFKGDQFFREVEENCYRAEPRVRECDQLGTTVQVLSTVPVMFSYWAKPADCLDLSRMLNDHISSICRTYPTRFIGLGTIPMQSAEHAIPELRRCIQELGMVGIQIGTHVNDKPLSDPMFFPIFEEAERLGACIFVHPWDMLGQDVMKKYWLPWLVGMPMETSFAICSLIFGGVFERLPKLRWCFAHGGGSFPGTIGRIEHGFAVRPDLVAIDNNVPPRTYCGKFWLDSLVHDHTALKAIVDLCGGNKITLGSDYPFPLGEDKPGELVLSSPHLTDAEKHRILWENGFEFLGLDPAKYLPSVTSTLPTITTSNGEQIIIMDDEKELDEQKHIQATDTSSITSTISSTSDSNSALNDLTAEVEALSMNKPSDIHHFPH